MAKKYTVVHKKSNVVSGGVPKLPSASTLEYGEIAINYGAGGETLSIRNSNDQIATFPSQTIVEGMISGAQIQSDWSQTATTSSDYIKNKPDVHDDGFGNVIIKNSTFSGGVVNISDGRNSINLGQANDDGILITANKGSDGRISLTASSNIELNTSGTNKAYYNNKEIAVKDDIPTTAAEVGAMATSERGNYLTTATTIPNVDNYFDDVEYDSGTKRINFKHGSTVKDYIDATDFIKDGMVDDVDISTPTGGTNSGVTCLVVTFNTDAGKEDIEIPLSQIFNPSNFYNKTEADEKFLTISSYTEDEEVIAAALNELDQRMDNLRIPSAAYEIDAMDISERGNYLITGSTLDDVADGTTRKLSNYSTTGHTHTAAEVGAMATSERNNYLTTATTIPSTAAEVGAMATSERSNYLPTGTTLDNVADGTTRKLSDYSTTGHSHTAAEVGAMATSERSNYSTTGHTHTAAEVGAMATSERGNYLTTATTIPTEATISSSGFTKNGITGINVNGTASTVTNGVAEITIPSGLPSVTASDNGKVLMVANGEWSAVTPTMIYTGSGTPQASTGNDGDIYLQTS